MTCLINRTIELRTVWVYECVHDLYAGIHKNVVSSSNPSEEEKSKNPYHEKHDESYVRQEEVLFIDNVPHFLHT